MDENIVSEPGLNYYLKNKWKLIVTLFCLFSFITMGIHLEISGSTMLHLSVQVGTDLANLSWIIAARSFGYCITILLFGLVFQSIITKHSESILAIGYLLPAAATASTPFLKSLWSLCLALFCQGLLHGISDLAVNTLLTRMWSIGSTGPLNGVYLGYAIGALLSILIVRSFRVNNDNIQSLNLGVQSELVGPYIIASVFCLITSIGFGLISYKQRKRNEKRKKEKVRIYQSVAKEEINIESKSKRLFNKAKFWKTCSPTTCGQGYFAYGFILITIILLFSLFFGGIEQGFTKFFISFVEKEKINVNKKDSVYSMIFYWVPMLIGRMLCAYLTSSYLSPYLMLSISLLCSLITYLLFIIFIWYIGLTRLTLFLLVIANGLSMSSISPTTVGWIKQFLALTPVELSLMLSSNALGGFVFGLLSGHIFQNYGAKHLFTILIILVMLTSICFILTFVIQHFHSNRKNQNTLTTVIKQDEQHQMISSHQQQITKYIDE